MNLSPKTRAAIASGLLVVVWMVIRVRYDYLFSQRLWGYISLADALLTTLVYQWVYHRHAVVPPPQTLPPAELTLVCERLPGLVWAAFVPPVVVMALMWWVTLHGGGLPWREGWLGPPLPAASHRTYLPTMIMVIAWTGVASWVVIYNLARWHGMPRTYPHRRERLRSAVLLQWITMVGMVAWAAGNNFYLPAPIATACAVAFGLGLFFVNAFGIREYRMKASEPGTGTWFYVDLRDPAFLGPRGLNLANHWALVLAAAALVPILLAEWLYHRAGAAP